MLLGDYLAQKTIQTICITFPDYLPNMGVLSCLLNQKCCQERDCLLLYNKPDFVRKELGANLPDEIFNNYQVTSILEETLKTDAYLFIDNYQKWMTLQPLLSKNITAKVIFLMTYSELAASESCHIDSILE